VSAYSLTFAWRLPYLRGPDRRWYPLVRVGVELGRTPLLIASALVDTGAPVTVFDGRLALSVGMPAGRLREEADDALPLKGLTGGASRAYVHPATLYVGAASEFSAIRSSVAFTDPDDPPLAFNLLGRSGFLEHVLLAVDESGVQSPNREPALYLRVRS
jgi:hypothetical protein